MLRTVKYMPQYVSQHNDKANYSPNHGCLLLQCYYYNGGRPSMDWLLSRELVLLKLAFARGQKEWINSIHRMKSFVPHVSSCVLSSNNSKRNCSRYVRNSNHGMTSCWEVGVWLGTRRCNGNQSYSLYANEHYLITPYQQQIRTDHR